MCMQKLWLEEKWAKTIASQDLLYIEETFEQCSFNEETDVFITYLKKAINHRKDLLLITLIHNCTSASFTLNNQNVIYLVEDEPIAKHSFSIPVRVPAYTSMPWTFIYPLNKYEVNKLTTRGSFIIES